MSNILVTGGAGFIGSHTVGALVARGDRVIVIDNFNDYYDPSYKEYNITSFKNDEGTKILRGDICDAGFLNETFRDNQIDSIIHLAAQPGVRFSLENPEFVQLVNVEGTRRVLETARNFGIRNVVIASSSSVYGNHSQLPFKETVKDLRPISPYGVSKKAVEDLALQYHQADRINSVCLRFFTVYGERGRPDMAPFKFTRAIMEGQPIARFGQGQTRRDYTYIGDIVGGILATLDKVSSLGYEIINLGRGQPIVLADFISVLEKAIGKKAVIKAAPEQAGDVRETFADITKARELLNYQPQVSIVEGVERLVSWYKQRFRI